MSCIFTPPATLQIKEQDAISATSVFLQLHFSPPLQQAAIEQQLDRLTNRHGADFAGGNHVGISCTNQHANFVPGPSVLWATSQSNESSRRKLIHHPQTGNNRYHSFCVFSLPLRQLPCIHYHRHGAVSCLVFDEPDAVLFELL